jgi:hypothetical protein
MGSDESLFGEDKPELVNPSPLTSPNKRGLGCQQRFGKHVSTGYSDLASTIREDSQASVNATKNHECVPDETFRSQITLSSDLFYSLIRLNVHCLSDGGGEIIRNPSLRSKASPPEAVIDEPPSKRRKAQSAKSDVFVKWAPTISTDITIDDVQESYRKAIVDGRLKHDQVPRLLAGSDGSSRVKCWDPYTLSSKVLSRSVLDSEKVKDIMRRLESTTRIVPTAVDWIAKSQEYNPAPEGWHVILGQAFSQRESVTTQHLEYDAELPRILRAAAKSLTLGNELKSRSTILKRTEAVLRMVAYALMEVSVVSGEATDAQVFTPRIFLFWSLATPCDWHKAVHSAAWSREEEQLSLCE